MVVSLGFAALGNLQSEVVKLAEPHLPGFTRPAVALREVAVVKVLKASEQRHHALKPREGSLLGAIVLAGITCLCNCPEG